MKFKGVLTAIVAIALYLPVLASADLPPKILKDAYMLELSEHLKSSDWGSARKTIDKLDGLKVKLPDTYAYFKGEVLYNTKEYRGSKIAFEDYLNKVGDKGRYYKEAISYYAKIDDEKTTYLKNLAEEMSADCKLSKMLMKEKDKAWNKYDNAPGEHEPNCYDACGRRKMELERLYEKAEDKYLAWLHDNNNYYTKQDIYCKAAWSNAYCKEGKWDYDKAKGFDNSENWNCRMP